MSTALPRRVAVVGAGMAGARFAESLSARADHAEVTLYGAEAHTPYNRTLLADVLTGRFTPRDIALPYGDPAVVARTGCEVVAVDTAARTLTLADGDTHPWDALVLATGANPVLPPLRGLRSDAGGLKDGVYTLRTLEDCQLLAAADARRAVVVGGGVLGVSAAYALAARGLPTEIVHQAPWLLERHLDAEASAALRDGLAELGVRVYPYNRARAVEGDDRVTGVRLATGYVLETDLVVLACGVRPRTGLAHTAGITVRRGIVVDDRLATSAPGVYAIGDCAEHRNVLHGLAGPAWDQADVLAARLSGTLPDALHRGSHASSRLTAGPLEYAAFGEVGDLPDTRVLRLSDATRGSYKKLVLRGDQLVGGILLGDLSTVGEVTRAFESGEPVPADPLHLLISGRNHR